METKELQDKIVGIETDLKKFIEKHAEEVKVSGTASTETKAALEKLCTQYSEASARLLAVEQKITAPGGGGGASESKSIGEKFVESDQFKAMAAAGAQNSGQVKVGSLHQKTTIVNATGYQQPLVAPFIMPGILTPGLQRLTVRDLLAETSTTSNLIEYARETAFTNNAAIQVNEGDVKAESALAFDLQSTAVKTLAHWIPASKQILSDAPSLQGYINQRLMYGLKFKEEQELLTGSGAGSEISGLITNATVFDTTRTTTASDTFIDVLSHALTQVRVGSFFEPDGIVLNTSDWETIQLTKSTQGEYLFADPHFATSNSIWGKPVVATTAIPRSQFLVGAFKLGAMIWDRWDATIEISREHSDYFTRNLVAILCEERLGLTVFRPLAFVYGGFPWGS